MPVRRELYAGVMSGTSLDGVDAVIAEFPASSGNVFAMLGVTHITFPSALRDDHFLTHHEPAKLLAHVSFVNNPNYTSATPDRRWPRRTQCPTRAGFL